MSVPAFDGKINGEMGGQMEESLSFKKVTVPHS
jgi:hypothetical protein